MIQIGAVLVDVVLQENAIAAYEVCPSDCELCIKSCPVGALDGRIVNQRLCRPLSNYRTEKGYTLMRCNVCRRVCPNSLGIKS